MAHVSLVGEREQYLAVTQWNEPRQLVFLERSTLRQCFSRRHGDASSPASETALDATLSGGAVAFHVRDPLTRRRTDHVLVATAGSFLFASTTTWTAHDVVLLRMYDAIDTRRESLEEVWRVKDVTPNANLRLPGARSSGDEFCILGETAESEFSFFESYQTFFLNT